MLTTQKDLDAQHNYVHIPKEKRDKLDGKSLKCIFLGYSETLKGYRFYNIETDKVFIERTAIFSE